MNVNLCDACGREFKWLDGERFHVGRYDRASVCGVCAREVMRAVRECRDRIRAANAVVAEAAMPTQRTLYQRWLALAPIKWLAGGGESPRDNAQAERPN